MTDTWTNQGTKEVTIEGETATIDGETYSGVFGLKIETDGIHFGCFHQKDSEYSSDLEYHAYIGVIPKQGLKKVYGYSGDVQSINWDKPL